MKSLLRAGADSQEGLWEAEAPTKARRRRRSAAIDRSPYHDAGLTIILRRPRFHAHVRVWRPRFEVADEPIGGAVAAGEGVLLTQDVVDRAALDPAPAERNHVLAKRRHLRRHRR